MKTMLMVLLLVVFPTMVFAQSSSPNPILLNDAIVSPIQVKQQAVNASEVITFSEFPIGTAITNQYENIGIIFGGSGPFISPDGANPTSPVLSGTPRFQGDITGRFVDPDSGNDTAVESFTFDAGYFDEFGSTRIEWFDPAGNKLGQRINSRLGIERLTFEGGNIASWAIAIVENEPAGYAIDNVSFLPIGPSILFREKSGDDKDGTWGFFVDDIPGFDHVGFHIDNKIYESHPGYPNGTYVSADGNEAIGITSINGVQSQHSRKTFEHDSTTTASTPVIDFEEIPIEQELATKMRDAIDNVGGATFQFIDYSLDGIQATLSPAAQKGGGNTFTCVGLVEWASEQADHNSGQGFIRNSFESFSVPDPRSLTFPPEFIEVPLLSPQLLNYAMKGQNLLQNATQWIQGFFDPVDFILIDPLGRKLGFGANTGHLKEIPNAFYSGDGGVEQFLIPNAIPGNYIVQLEGVNKDVFVATGALGSTKSFNGFLATGESTVQTLFVKPKPGTGGDVNIDGDVDEDDILALLPLLNRFTDGLGHPGDLDGDGLLSDADVELLTELVDILAVTPPEALCQDVIVPTEPGLCTADASVDAGSSDPDGDPIILDQSPSGPYELGDTIVTLTVTDDQDLSDQCTATVTVIDQEPPVINNLVANPNVLWPPNHKMKPVTVTAEASDNCAANPDIVLVSVISNEPDDAPGGGDGHTINDIQDADIGTEDYNISLRAERSGSGDGRIYTVTYKATDYAGNNTTADATVTVPHDKGKKK